MEQQTSIVFEGVSFAVRFIVKGMAFMPEYEHIWRGQTNRIELFQQLYDIIHVKPKADVYDKRDVRPVQSIERTTGAGTSSL